MFRSFIKNTSYILALNMLVKATWVLGIEVWVQNKFSVEDYGIYYTLLNLSLIFSFLLDFGISKYQNIQSAKEQAINYPFIKTLSLLKLTLAIIYLILTVLISGYLSLTSEQRLYLLILSLSQVILSYIIFIRSIFSGLGKFILEGVFSTLDRILMTIMCVVWLTANWIEQDINQYIWIQFIGYAAAFLFAVTMLVRLLQAGTKQQRNTFQHDIKSILIFVMPFAFLNAAEIVNDRLGVIMINQLIPDAKSQIGLYAYGQRWLDAFKMFASLIAIILVTYYSLYKDSGNHLRKLVKYCIIFFAMPVIVASFLAAYNSEYFVQLIYKDTTEAGHLNFRYSILTTIPYSLIYIFQPLLLVKSKVRWLNYFFLIGLIINIGSCFVLIPKFQSVGCAIAFLITSMSVSILQVVKSSIWAEIQINLINTTKSMLALASSVIVPALIFSANPLLQILVGLVAYFTLIFTLKIINKNELGEINKQKNK